MKSSNAMSKNSKEKIIFMLAYFAVLVIILALKNEMSDVESRLYSACTFAYVIILGLYCFRRFVVMVDMFEPITIITLLYSFIFIFEPLIDLLQDSTSWFGFYYLQYGVKSTWIAVFGYIAFFIAYSYNNSSLTKIRQKPLIQNSEDQKRRLALTGLYIWLVGYLLMVAFLILTGKSLIYIITGGLTGDGDLLESRSVLGSLSMFSYTLIGSWALYYVYGKKKLVKIVLFLLTVFAYYLRGYRFIIVIYALVPIVIHYLKNNKRPKAISFLLCLVIVIFFIGYVAVVRNSVRYGYTISLANFSWENSIEQAKENFRIYNTYYALVGIIPSKVDYFLGQQMFLYTLVMFVPRIFWISKPLTSPGLSVIGDAISPYAVSAGTAYPIIGEYYLEFGIFGVVLFMFLYGLFERSVLKKFEKTNSELSIITYAILLLANFQIIIRGYTPSNFYMVIFFMLPCAAAHYIERRID